MRVCAPKACSTILIIYVAFGSVVTFQNPSSRHRAISHGLRIKSTRGLRKKPGPRPTAN
jgi:hypothetical protein